MPGTDGASEPRRPRTPVQELAGLPRQNVGWTLVLTVATGGFYIALWLLGRSRALNRRLAGRRISPIYMAFCTAVAALALGAFLLELSRVGDRLAADLSRLLGALDTYLTVGWALRFRHRWNLLTGAGRKDRWFAGVLGTFFLSVLYLQAKVNRAAEEAALAGRGHVPDAGEAPPPIVPKPAGTGRGRRLVGLLARGLEALPVALILLALFGPGAFALLARARYEALRTRVEERLGPLDAGRLPGPSEAARRDLDLLSRAAARLDLSEADRSLLRRVAEEPGGEILSRRRPDLGRIVRANSAALELAGGVRPPAAGLGLPYLDADRQLPDSLPSVIQLSRLSYVDGGLALVDGDGDRLRTDLRRLGSLAATFEGEPCLIPQLLGLVAEKEQLRLLHLALAGGGPLGGGGEPANLLVRVDLEGAYRRSLRCYAAFWRRSRDRPRDLGLAREPGGGLPELAGFWAGRGTLDFMVAGAFDSTLEYAAAYRLPVSESHRRLTESGEARSFLAKLRRFAALSDPDLVARYRAVATSRALARGALAAPPFGSQTGCRGEVSLPDGAGRVSALRVFRDGRCRLEAADRGEYARLLPAKPLTAPLSWPLGPGSERTPER